MAALCCLVEMRRSRRCRRWGLRWSSASSTTTLLAPVRIHAMGAWPDLPCNSLMVVSRHDNLAVRMLTGLCSTVFDFLVHSHSATAFNSSHTALAKLAEFDPPLAAAWGAILHDPSQRTGLCLYDFDSDLDEVALTDENTPRAIVAGCRRRLLTDRLDAFSALRRGFLLLEDLQVFARSCSMEMVPRQLLHGICYTADAQSE